jgi:Protein of unknown function (DUF2892)
MTQNIGDADRTLRMAGGALTAVAFFGVPQGALRTVLGIVSVLLLGTSLSGWSPLYFILRMSTRSDKDAKPLERR